MSQRRGSSKGYSSRPTGSRQGSSHKTAAGSHTTGSSHATAGSGRQGTGRPTGSSHATAGSSRQGTSRPTGSSHATAGSSRQGTSRPTGSSHATAGSSRQGTSRPMGSSHATAGSRKGSYKGHSGSSRKKRRIKRWRRFKKWVKHFLPLILLIAVIAAVIVIIALAFSHRRSSITLELIGDSVVTTSVGAPYEDEGAVAFYRGEDISDEIHESDDVDIWDPGTYEVTYFVERGNRSREVTREIEVRDQVAPEIVLNGDPVMAVDDLNSYTELGATAVDDVDGDITDQISISSEDESDGTRIISYTVTDHAGNSTTVTRKLVPYDEAAPVITLNGDETIVMDANQPFDDPGVTVTDTIDGDLSDSVTKTGWVDVYRPDTYTLTYTATDSSGNSASVTRTVIVESVPSTDPGSIYLTFDDGPSLEVTPTILDILDANDIKATFFIIDYTEEELPLIERMIEEGHTVGIHSYTHIYSQIYQSVDAFMEDIDALWLKLYNDTGYEAFVMRFPGGSVNEWSADYCVGIMTDLVQLVSEEGWMYMDWNVDSGDSDETTTESSSYIVDKTIGQLDPTRKNVVLMHDMELKTTTAEALQSIIDYGKENGYTFKAIQPDTVPIHQPVMN